MHSEIKAIRRKRQAQQGGLQAFYCVETGRNAMRCSNHDIQRPERDLFNTVRSAPTLSVRVDPDSCARRRRAADTIALRLYDYSGNFEALSAGRTNAFVVDQLLSVIQLTPGFYWFSLKLQRPWRQFSLLYALCLRRHRQLSLHSRYYV